jgi:hypothetical protein
MHGVQQAGVIGLGKALAPVLVGPAVEVGAAISRGLPVALGFVAMSPASEMRLLP